MNRCPHCYRLLKHVGLIQFGSRDKKLIEKCEHCRITYTTRLREWMGVWQVQNSKEKRPTVQNEKPQRD